MNLIILRINSNIPVIIQGETGCGKTYLIRYLVEDVMQEELNIFHVHAGITTKDIVEKMIEINKRASDLNNKKRVWVFFDEFNTSNALPNICEIIVER